MVYTFFKKKPSAGAVTRVDKSAIESEIILKQHLAKKLRKPIIRKCKNVHTIRDAYLEDMKFISRYNKEF